MLQPLIRVLLACCLLTYPAWAQGFEIPRVPLPTTDPMPFVIGASYTLTATPQN